MGRIKYLSVFLCLALVLSCDTDNVFSEEEQLRNDVSLIEQFIADNNINAFSFENGIHIAVQTQGSGNSPRFGDSVICHYRGYLLDGTEFDSSEGRGPFDFVLGRGDVIRGWDLAFQEINKGTVATFYIPSGLAYGNTRRPGIPPNSVLIFDVNLLDIR